jgi:hypothetical protein
VVDARNVLANPIAVIALSPLPHRDVLISSAWSSFFCCSTFHPSLCLQLNVRPDIQLFLEDSILSFPGGHFSFVGNISPDFAFPSSSRDSIRLSKHNSLSTQPTFFRIDSSINSTHKITAIHSFILRNQSTELESTKDLLISSTTLPKQTNSQQQSHLLSTPHCH